MTIIIVLALLLIAVVLLLVFARRSYREARQAGKNPIIAAFSAIWDLLLERL
ncbi:hypothetical protein [Oenococcus kitaharae]|uniref:Uncharacterized protein n=1 Tax=Oenococcus kitaharae DSM 17330 TaxID=1045004 RepID=G9WHY7_9LACO|nr:hypothetical protein [Oenococcus kitaharae]EHN58872.1 hypothetical protein OKIT_0763 [Oenococcus kitaharae DSM 17330]MCV3296854.1 hypothetical protein [Oenococcus kitaharae]